MFCLPVAGKKSVIDYQIFQFKMNSYCKRKKNLKYLPQLQAFSDITRSNLVSMDTQTYIRPMRATFVLRWNLTIFDWLSIAFNKCFFTFDSALQNYHLLSNCKKLITIVKINLKAILGDFSWVRQITFWLKKRKRFLLIKNDLSTFMNLNKNWKIIAWK